MLVAHVSDAHLGRRQYGLEERREDYIRAFREAFSIIGEKDVDLVLIAGDLFNDLNPQPSIYREAIDALKALRKPVVIIGGNHDWRPTAPGASPLQVVASLEFVKFLGQNDFVDFDNLRIIGISSITKDLAPRVFNMARRMVRNNVKNLLMVHQAVSGIPALRSIGEDVWTVGRELLDGLNVDYIAGGHVHIHALKHPDLPLWYSGSLEAWDLNDFERWVYDGGKLSKVSDQADKGFLLVEVGEKPSIRPVRIPKRRRLVRVDVVYEDFVEPSKLRRDLESLRVFDLNDVVLHIGVRGELKGGVSVRDLEVHKLKRIFSRPLRADLNLCLAKVVRRGEGVHQGLSIRDITKQVLLRQLAGAQNAEALADALLKAMDYLEAGDEGKALTALKNVVFN